MITTITIRQTAVRLIAPPVLTWTVLASGAAYAMQLPGTSAVPSDLVVQQLNTDSHAANVRAALADLHGFA